MTIETLKIDLNIVLDAIIEGDNRDAKQMLLEVIKELESKTIIL